MHELSNYSDFIKVVMYNNCGGERMALYVDNIGSTLYGDLSKQELIDFNYEVMGSRSAATIRFLRQGFPLTTSTARRNELWRELPARTLRSGQASILTSRPRNNSKRTPQSVKEAVLAAFRAGAPGVILSRKYSEMRLANLSGAGDAIRDLNLSS